MITLRIGIEQLRVEDLHRPGELKTVIEVAAAR
jgi:hypothetical protein